MLAAYVLMCLIYGTTFLAIKLGLQSGVPPFLFAGIRFGAAGVLILLFLYVRKAAFPRTVKEWFDLAGLGTCMTGIPFAALYWGEQYISSGLAALLTASGPMMVLLINLVVEKKTPVIRQYAGLLIGGAGIYLVVLPHLQIGYSLEWLIGAVAILLSEIAFAWGAVFSKRLLSSGLAPLAVNGFQMAFGSLGLLILSLLFEPHDAGAFASTTVWGSLVYLAGFGSIVASGIYYWLVKRTNPLFPTTWVYVSPVIALFVGALLLNEPIYPASIAGTVMIISGVVLTNLPDLQNLRQAKQAGRA